MYKQTERKSGTEALKAPVHAYLELTQACNLKCRHCFNSTRFSGEKIQEAPIEQIVDKLIEWEVFDVTISGGEAMMRKPRLYSVLRKLKKAEISASLNTNLTMLTQEDIELMRQYRIKGILTTLHSSESQIHDIISGKEGSFEDTVKGIEIAVNAGIRPEINMVYSTQTRGGVYNLGKLANELGAKSFTLGLFLPNLQIKDHYLERVTPSEIIDMLWELHAVNKEFKLNVGLQRSIPFCFFWNFEELRTLVNRSCGSRYSSITVKPNGDISDCIASNRIEGNILRESLQEIWKKMIAKPVCLPESTCYECDLSAKCRGGCKLENLSYGNDKNPLIKGQIKLEKCRNRQILPGMTIGTNCERIIARKEDNTTYFVKQGNQYFLMPIEWFNVLKEIALQGSIKIGKDILAHTQLINNLECMLTEGILKLQEATDD